VRLCLTALLATFVLSSAALAAPPRPHARAYVVENASTGEVLLQHDARARLPIASITKLMTVLVTLEHARLDDLVTVAASAATVGESSIGLRVGERLTVLDLVKGALIQSANDAADALADYVARGDQSAFVAMMNAEARRLRLADTHFVRPDGLDAAGHFSSARDVTRLAQTLMHRPIVRGIVRERTDTIAGGRVLHTWNDLLGQFPGLIGVKTGHTGAAGWCEVGAARGPGLTIYATVLGDPSRSVRNDDLAALLRWGLSRYRTLPVIAGHTAYAQAAVGYGRAPLELVASHQLRRSVRIDHRLAQRVIAPTTATLPVRRGERLGRVGWYAGRAVHHVLHLFR
jgi:D-alanyl-D-alanine carboxypeptidase (penicillin-binding protein 5/6)